MKFTTTVTHEIEFEVGFFEATEGGMYSDTFGKPTKDMGQALRNYELAMTQDPEKDWVIVGNVTTSVNGEKRNPMTDKQPTFSGYLVDLSQPKDKRLDWSDMDKQFTPGQRVIWERNGLKAEVKFVAVCGGGRPAAEVETLKGWDIAPLSELTPAESLPAQSREGGA